MPIPEHRLVENCHKLRMLCLDQHHLRADEISRILFESQAIAEQTRFEHIPEIFMLYMSSITTLPLNLSIPHLKFWSAQAIWHYEKMPKQYDPNNAEVVGLICHNLSVNDRKLFDCGLFEVLVAWWDMFLKEIRRGGLGVLPERVQGYFEISCRNAMALCDLLVTKYWNKVLDWLDALKSEISLARKDRARSLLACELKCIKNIFADGELLVKAGKGDFLLEWLGRAGKYAYLGEAPIEISCAEVINVANNILRNSDVLLPIGASGGISNWLYALLKATSESLGDKVLMRSALEAIKNLSFSSTEIIEAGLKEELQMVLFFGMKIAMNYKDDAEFQKLGVGLYQNMKKCKLA